MMSDDRPRDFDALVIGGGPAGSAAAAALAIKGLRTALAAPPHRPLGPKPDSRTAALFGGSVDLLRNLGVWAGLEPLCTPISAIRIVDDCDRLLRAPEALFRAQDVGLAAFGYNVPNDPLTDAIRARLRALTPEVSLFETDGVAKLSLDANGATAVTREGQELRARLVVAADGRRSMCRQTAGIGTRAWSYPQSAVTCVFSHSRAHNHVSTELHRPAGPFTVVPLPGRVSSLVWVERPEEAERLARLADGDFRDTIETRLRGLLGTVGDLGARGLFPLSGLRPDTFAANRVALVGESGHVIPPIGAQGLNLGLRDAATIADCAAEARAAGRDVGGSDTLDAYSKARQFDVSSRLTAVDVLNRSLLADSLPVHIGRGLGVTALTWIGPLRRFVVREGMQPSRGLPSLMRGA